EPAWGPLSFYESSQITQEGLYGVARFSLAEPLKLIVGARVSNYEKTGHGIYTPAYDIEHKREVTPYAGLILDVTKNVSAYASYTDIFLPQSVRNASGAYLDPILGRSVEAGFKGEFFDGGLNVSAAAFRIEQDNLGQSTGA
ncbi:TonB-dependent receptor, partial [Acinetobacter baumannii]